MKEEQGKVMQSRGNIADDVLAAYKFGEGVTVVEQDNWDTGDPNDYTKIVYVAYDDDASDADSHKVSFHVRFNKDGSIDDAYALEMEHGNDIGQRGDINAEAGKLADKAFDGWVVLGSSGISAQDILELGFEIKDHRLYPDDIAVVADLLGKAGYSVTDVSMPGTTSWKGLPPRCLKIDGPSLERKVDAKQSVGYSVGGFTVGNLATMTRSKAVGTIVALSERDGQQTVTLEFEEPQPVDAPEGVTATRFELNWRNISSTWAPPSDRKEPCK